MTEAEERDMVVKETVSCLHTPYKHMGQAKGRGGGLDCGTLLICVYSNVGFIEFFTPEPYSPDFMMHNTQERYLKIVLDRAREIDETEAGPGDVVLYKVGHLYAHGGIIVEGGWDNIIHAYNDMGIVARGHGKQGKWGRRPRRFFSYWGQ